MKYSKKTQKEKKQIKKHENKQYSLKQLTLADERKNPEKKKEKTEKKDNTFLSNKKMIMDFDSNILEKLTNTQNKNNNNSNIKNSWNYNKIISKEKQFKEEDSNNNKNNKLELKEEANNTDAKEESEEEDNKDLEDRFDNELFEKDASFTDFGLSKLFLKACADLNFFHPTKVQAKVIPLILEKSDVLVNAETGSGKTACYLLPILQRILISKKSKNPIKTLLILPTRELAVQCSQMLTNLIKYIDVISHVVIVGGMDIKNQINQLSHQPDVIIATPGRLIDMIYNYKSIELDFINVLILDEADKLLELGFKDAILEILNKMGKLTKTTVTNPEATKKGGKKVETEYVENKIKSFQTLLFSATLNTKVIDLGNQVLRNPLKLKLAHSNVLNNLKQSIVRMKFKSQTTSDNIDKENSDNDADNEEEENEEDEEVSKKKKNLDKFAQKLKNKQQSTKKSFTKNYFTADIEFIQRMTYLLALVSNPKRRRSIIFFNTKADCHKAQVILQDFNIVSAEMHSDIYQTQRLEALEKFQEGKIHYLLATDVAGRGIDVDKVKCVINFQMPLHSERYIHRIGRTARKGNLGNAITICNEVDRTIFKKLLKDQKFPLHPLKVENSEIKTYYKDLMSKKKEYIHIFEQDYANRELEQAEMQVKKSIRKIDYEDEIMNKPRKSWYMNTKQKKDLRSKSKKDYLDSIN